MGGPFDVILAHAEPVVLGEAGIGQEDFFKGVQAGQLIGGAEAHGHPRHFKFLLAGVAGVAVGGEAGVEVLGLVHQRQNVGEEEGGLLLLVRLFGLPLRRRLGRVRRVLEFIPGRIGVCGRQRMGEQIGGGRDQGLRHLRQGRQGRGEKTQNRYDNRVRINHPFYPAPV